MHQTIENNLKSVLITTFSWGIGWLFVAIYSNLYGFNPGDTKKVVLRAFLGMIIASPFAAMVRGFLLGTFVQPIFIVVFGGIASIAISIWRVFYFAFLVGESSNG